MRPRCSAIVATLFVAACVCAPAFADGNSNGPIYTWVDKNGVRHYSDHPRNADAKTLKIPAPAGLTMAMPLQLPSATTTSHPPSAQTAAAPNAVESPQARAARCATLRDQVERLQSARRVEVTENGVSRFLAGDDLVAFKQTMQQKMHEACAPPTP